MLSSEDLERFYFQYQTEAVPLGMSVQTFCLRNNVPYNIFHKWYKDTRKNSGSSGGWCSLGSTIGVRAVFTFRGNPGKEGQSFSPCSTQTPEAGQSPGALPVRISVELTLSNGLHILQKDLIIRVCTV